MRKKLLIAALLVLGTAVSCSKMSCSRKQTTDAGPGPTATPDDKPDYSGITVERVLTKDLKEGKGTVVKDGDTVSGRYTAWIYDPKKLANKGKQFSASAEKELFSFKVGEGKVVKGWEQGVIGMKAGGLRSMIIPIALGYGDKGNDSVPPNSILLVEFELVQIK